MITAVLLAAGRSTRFGGDKLLALLRGKPVIRWSAESLASVVDELVVVVPEGSSAMRTALHGLPVRFVENPRRAEGMSSSLTAGIVSLGAQTDAVLVALADQPEVRSEVVSALITRWRMDRPSAVAPMYEDGRGHPVLFDRRCLAALLALKGDVGARAVLESLGAEVALLPVTGAQPADVDTAEALERLERSQRPGT